MPAASGLRDRNAIALGHPRTLEGPTWGSSSQSFVCPPTPHHLPHFTPSPLTPTVSPLCNPPQDPSKLKAKPAIVSEVPIPNGDRPAQAFQGCCPGGQPGGRVPAPRLLSLESVGVPRSHQGRVWGHWLAFCLEAAPGTKPYPILQSGFYSSTKPKLRLIPCSPDFRRPPGSLLL